MTVTSNNGSSGRRVRKVKFGAVTVTAPAPPRASVVENVKLSTLALERAAERMAKPGVRLRHGKSVPLYFLDSDDPDLVIRQVDGKTERGRLRDGKFCVIE